MLPEEDQPGKPVIPEWLSWVWRAWHRLHADRVWYGGGFGPASPAPRIPWLSIVAWCQFNGYSGADVAFLDECCRVMDGVFVAWHAERVKETKP